MKNMKKLACRDVGVNCNFVATGETEEEVMQKAGEHGKKVHGYTDADFTPEMIDKIRAAIKDA
jgi:predicted small metal-binding protein